MTLDPNSPTDRRIRDCWKEETDIGTINNVHIWNRHTRIKHTPSMSPNKPPYKTRVKSARTQPLNQPKCWDKINKINKMSQINKANHFIFAKM